MKSGECEEMGGQQQNHTDGSSIILLSFGGFLLIFGLSSFVIRGKFFLTTAPVALLCGIAFGPRGAK
jgi:NhaP-type Na+/H+ or K+/H+ antiporter